MKRHPNRLTLVVCLIVFTALAGCRSAATAAHTETVPGAVATIAAPVADAPASTTPPPASEAIRGENSPAAEMPPLALQAPEVPANRDTLTGPGSNCKNDRGQVYCSTQNRQGMYLDIHPHAPTVTFYIDVYLSECNLPGVKDYNQFSISQESRRYTRYRFNQASVVHWNWRPINPCWQAWVKDCKVDGKPRDCVQVLDVNGVLLP
jgi:hypothetical protein